MRFFSTALFVSVMCTNLYAQQVPNTQGAAPSQRPGPAPNPGQQTGTLDDAGADRLSNEALINRGNTPNLVANGPIVIEVPQLSVKAWEPITIDVPELTVKAWEPIVIELPELTVIAKQEDDSNEDQGEDDTAETAQSGTAPSAPKNPGICVGYYQMHIGKTVGASGTHTMPVGTPKVARAVVTSKTCGASLVMQAQGKSILLQRTGPNTKTYQGTINLGDGAKRQLTLTCTNKPDLFGLMQAQDNRMGIKPGIWLNRERNLDATVSNC